MTSVLPPLIKLIVFTVVTAVATAMLAFTIANTNFEESSDYTARFTDATGLLVGDDVRIAGVPVGTVEAVEVVDRRFAEVRFSVADSQQLPASVTAQIRYRNLIGQRYLALDQGAGPPGQTLDPGATIPIERTKPALNLTVLFNGFRPLFTALDPQQVNQLSFEIIQVLQGEGGTMESLLASTASLTSEIANRDQLIGEVIGNLNAVLDTVNARDEQLSELIVSMQQLVSGFAEDRRPIGEAITSLAELTDVTAGLVGEARPAVRADIAALDDLATNLADSEQVIDRMLQYWPVKLAKIIPLGSYGSWFNFYSCGLSGHVLIPQVTDQRFELPVTNNRNPRCSP